MMGKSEIVTSNKNISNKCSLYNLPLDHSPEGIQNTQDRLEVGWGDSPEPLGKNEKLLLCSTPIRKKRTHDPKESPRSSLTTWNRRVKSQVKPSATDVAVNIKKYVSELQEISKRILKDSETSEDSGMFSKPVIETDKADKQNESLSNLLRDDESFNECLIACTQTLENVASGATAKDTLDPKVSSRSAGESRRRLWTHKSDNHLLSPVSSFSSTDNPAVSNTQRLKFRRICSFDSPKSATDQSWTSCVQPLENQKCSVEDLKLEKPQLRRSQEEIERKRLEAKFIKDRHEIEKKRLEAVNRRKLMRNLTDPHLTGTKSMPEQYSQAIEKVVRNTSEGSEDNRLKSCDFDEVFGRFKSKGKEQCVDEKSAELVNKRHEDALRRVVLNPKQVAVSTLTRRIGKHKSDNQLLSSVSSNSPVDPSGYVAKRQGFRRMSSFESPATSSDRSCVPPLKKQKSFFEDLKLETTLSQRSQDDIEKNRLEAKYIREKAEIDRKRLEALNRKLKKNSTEPHL